MLGDKLNKKILYVCTLVFLSFTGCTVYHVHDFKQPPVTVPVEFIRGNEGEGNIDKWWQEFNQPELNELVELALRQNLDIQQAWSRLTQARATACIVSSELYPEVNLGTSAEFVHEINHPKDTNSSFMNYFVTPTLSYEVDLWRKIDSRVQAADLNYKATFEDLEGTALLIAGNVVNLWFVIQEQKALLDVIAYQVEVSEMLLELVELRFALGQSSALDVYQQRLQLEDTRITAIPVQAFLKNSSHQLSTLLGYAPTENWAKDLKFKDIDLPEFPDIGSPAELISRRPDLRSLYYKVEAADFEVAAAIADMFPRLTLPTIYDLRTRDIKELFQEEIFRIAARFVTPIFDGFRRCCEVTRRKAIVKERLDNFAQKFLLAMVEIEDAIVNEEAEIELIKQIAKQIEIAKLNLEEARLRYATGLNDYLTVISAIQALQRLERRMIVEHRLLLVTRSNLYRALGGATYVRCTKECKE